MMFITMLAKISILQNAMMFITYAFNISILQNAMMFITYACKNIHIVFAIGTVLVT